MDKGSDINVAERVDAITSFQKEALEKLHMLDGELGTWFEEICAANILLSNKRKARGPAAPPPKAGPQPAAAQVLAAQGQPTGEDYKASIEKLLQGSIDALGDKLSDKIVGMLKELKTMAGPVREAKISEIWNAAQSEHVDLAAMFLHEKVESNLGADGLKIEEKKTQGIGSILDKLKKLKGGEGAGKTGEGGP